MIILKNSSIFVRSYRVLDFCAFSRYCNVRKFVDKQHKEDMSKNAYLMFAMVICYEYAVSWTQSF